MGSGSNSQGKETCQELPTTKKHLVWEVSGPQGLKVCEKSIVGNVKICYPDFRLFHKCPLLSTVKNEDIALDQLWARMKIDDHIRAF